jgi:hypothetical protein
VAENRTFWQVLVVTAKSGAVHTRVLEYSSKELAEEVLDACKKADAAQNYVFVGAFRLYSED